MISITGNNMGMLALVVMELWSWQEWPDERTSEQTSKPTNNQTYGQPEIRKQNAFTLSAEEAYKFFCQCMKQIQVGPMMPWCCWPAWRLWDNNGIIWDTVKTIKYSVSCEGWNDMYTCHDHLFSLIIFLVKNVLVLLYITVYSIYMGQN